MATKINAGDDVRRSDYYMVDPFQIILREENRGRKIPPTEEQIVKLAMSMMERGQQQAVQCRKIAGQKVELVSGFTRVAAARLIRKGFTDINGDFCQDEKFFIKLMVGDANEKNAFFNNIVENLDRNETSAIDDAYNQHRMRDQYGMTDTDIAKFYKYKNTTKVGRLRRLLALPDEIQMLVHFKRLPIQAAIDILDIEDVDMQKEMFAKVLAEAESGEEKIVASEIRSQVRDLLNDDDRIENEESDGAEVEAVAKKKTKTKPRTEKEQIKFFEKLKEEHIDVSVKTFCDIMIRWKKGQRSDKSMREAIDKLLDEERS